MQFIFGNVPPQESGGFHFPQRLASGDFFQLTASTKDELDRAVMDFRVRNSLPIGDPTRETNEYLCAKWPHYCKPDDPIEADESPKNKTLRQRVTNWSQNRYSQTQENHELENEETALERIKICQNCPAKQKWQEGCPPCVASTERTLFLISKGLSKSVPDAGGCSICGWDNSTAAMLKPHMLKSAKLHKDKLPDFCWAKSL